MNLKEQSLEQAIPGKHGKNFSLLNTGPLSDLAQYKLKHPLITNRLVSGKLFLKDHLQLTGMQVSMNMLAPGISTPFTHKHKENEELYIFIRGKGQILIDEELLDVEEGTAIRISTTGDRGWRNLSDEPLYFIVIQAKENSLGQDTFDDGIASSGPPAWPE